MPEEVELHDGWLRVRFAGRGHADFHFRWLRHNCDRDLHPLTRERVLCSSELPDRLEIAQARIDGDALVIRWAHAEPRDGRDGRESRFALAWLEEHAYARDRVAAPPPPGDLARIELDGLGLSLGERVRRALANLDAHGAAVVRRGASETRPAEEETEAIVEAFAAGGLRVIGTHFGRIEDLRTDNTTNVNTDQLGYTDAPVDLHTDQPFLEAPPRLQLLQAIRPAAAGGESYLVDARAAAEHLRSIDEGAWTLLTTTPARFHRKQRAFEKILDAPFLELDGERFRVRWSYFTLAPYQLPFAQMEAWYRAHDRFARLVRDPRHQYRFALRAGDFVLYDNHRMLHARTGFRGARWVRGVYFDR
jgi:gamma-butyrobetaine dioxygenase/trimethyllysine dioxygenase